MFEAIINYLTQWMENQPIVSPPLRDRSRKAGGVSSAAYLREQRESFRRGPRHRLITTTPIYRAHILCMT